MTANSKKDHTFINMDGENDDLELAPPMTSSTTKSGAVRLRITNIFNRNYANVFLENIYQQYFNRQREKDQRVLIIYAILFDVGAVVLNAFGHTKTSVYYIFVFIVALIANGTIYLLQRSRKLPASVVKYLPLVVYALMCTQIYVDMTRSPIQASNGVGPVLFLSFSVYIMLPFRLGLCAFFSILACGCHLFILGAIGFEDPDTGYMVSIMFIW